MEDKKRFIVEIDGIKFEDNILTYKEVINKLKQKWVELIMKNTDEVIISICIPNHTPIKKESTKYEFFEDLKDKICNCCPISFDECNANCHIITTINDNK